MRDAASEAYSILTKSLDGQLADSVIDAACLGAMVSSAEAYGCDFMKKYAQLYVISSDIKTAYRCCLLNKSQHYTEIALCGCDILDKSALIRAASSGTDTLLSYLENSGFREYSDALHESTAAFEKLCDEKLIELAQEAGTKAFGPEPLAAYYIAKETEIKNLRIISVCKSCGVSDDAIRERMRRAYV
jgi:V/A-type H+-transporting ATPase subunit C